MCPKTGKEYPLYMTVRIDPATRKALEEMAKAEDRPVSSMARIILKEGVEARRKKGRKKSP
jgi:predicted transcriptional regulator